MLLGLAVGALVTLVYFGLMPFWLVVLHFATADKDMLPDYIKQRKHDDWVWPLSLIPRRWTSWVLPMPPKQVAGNAPLSMHDCEPNYPLAPGAGGLSFEAPDPVPPVGCWTLQAVWLWKFWLPCYWAWSKMVFGRRLYMNAGIKPDISYDPVAGTRNYHWGFPEASLTWMKVS